MARILGAFAEASVAALGFVLAILLVGMPIAFAARVVHDLGVWVIGIWKGGTLVAALASFASVVAIICVVVLFVSVVVDFVQSPRRRGVLSERITRIASFKEY